MNARILHDASDVSFAEQATQDAYVLASVPLASFIGEQANLDFVTARCQLHNGHKEFMLSLEAAYMRHKRHSKYHVQVKICF